MVPQELGDNVARSVKPEAQLLRLTLQELGEMVEAARSVKPDAQLLRTLPQDRDPLIPLMRECHSGSASADERHV